MLSHVFSALCQSSSFDAIHSTLNIISVIEKLTAESAVPIQVTTPPVGVPGFQIVTVLFNDSASDQTGTHRITLISPNTQELLTHQVNFVVQSMKHHRIIASLGSMPYAGEGLYWIEVSLEKGKSWETAARLPFVFENKLIAPQIAVGNPPKSH
jgi:hypothetical protein